eukprot:g8264.t1
MTTKELRACDKCFEISNNKNSERKLKLIAKTNWHPNNEHNTCELCDDVFTLTFRRHHCRYCGKVVCSNCSKVRTYLGEALKFATENIIDPISEVCDDGSEVLENTKGIRDTIDDFINTVQNEPKTDTQRKVEAKQKKKDDEEKNWQSKGEKLYDDILNGAGKVDKIINSDWAEVFVHSFEGVIKYVPYARKVYSVFKAGKNFLEADSKAIMKCKELLAKMENYGILLKNANNHFKIKIKNANDVGKLEHNQLNVFRIYKSIVQSNEKLVKLHFKKGEVKRAFFAPTMMKKLGKLESKLDDAFKEIKNVLMLEQFQIQIETREIVLGNSEKLDKNSEKLDKNSEKLDKLLAELAPLVKPAPFPDDKPPWPREISEDKLFTGNKERLESLFKEMWEQTSSSTTKIVCQDKVFRGMGGIGKTAIVKAYARLYRKHYSGGVYWVSADTRESLEYSFRYIATVNLGMAELENEKEIDIVIGNVLKWFHEHHQPWLIIYDNADNLELIHKMKCFPNKNEARGHVFLTTRADQTSRFLTDLGFDATKDIVHISTLPQKDAEMLLLRCATRKAESSINDIKNNDEKEALSWLAGKNGLAGLPLALRQAGAYICETRCTWSDYKKKYEEAEVKTKMMSDDTRDEKTVWTTWRLNVENLSPDAKLVLQLSSFIGPENKPLEFVKLALNGIGPACVKEYSLLHVNTSDVSSAFTRSINTNELLRELARFSLVEWNENDPTLFSMHRLVQQVEIDNIRVIELTGGRNKMQLLNTIAVAIFAVILGILFNYHYVGCQSLYGFLKLMFFLLFEVVAIMILYWLVIRMCTQG